MDNTWERSIPFYPVDLATASELFRQFDVNAKLETINPLTEGKRNTNYRIHTAVRDYVLRIFPFGDESWLKESKIRIVMQGQVPLQSLLYMDQHERIDNRAFAIYEFVKGQTLLESMLSGYKPNQDIMCQLGEILATIHLIRYEQIGFLNGKLEVAEVLTPLNTWYEYFLNTKVRQRLGINIVKRIERIVIENHNMLREMDHQISLVHGDFRPTNLLISEGRINCVLDWEFAMSGHSIADIGQLFRYDDQFPVVQRNTFAQAYNERSSWELPADWENQGNMRDLVNLLQMLGVEGELPVKFSDLIRLIEGILRKLERDSIA